MVVCRRGSDYDASAAMERVVSDVWCNRERVDVDAIDGFAWCRVDHEGYSDAMLGRKDCWDRREYSGQNHRDIVFCQVEEQWPSLGWRSGGVEGVREDGCDGVQKMITIPWFLNLNLEQNLRNRMTYRSVSRGERKNPSLSP